MSPAFMLSAKRLTSLVGWVAIIFSGLGPAGGVRARQFPRGSSASSIVLASVALTQVGP